MSEDHEGLRRRSRAPIHRGISEFGEVLGDYLQEVAGSIGAVLTDDEGNPIDFALRQAALSDLEIQLAGAQLERPLDELRQRSTDARTLRVTIAASRRLLLAAALADHTLVALHHAEHNLERVAQIESAFEGLISRLYRLLDA